MSLGPLEYNFEYSMSLKTLFLLISRKVRCSALSRFKLRPSFNFPSFYLSLMHSVISLIYLSLFKTTILFHLTESVLAISLLGFNFCKMLCMKGGVKFLKGGVYLYT